MKLLDLFKDIYYAEHTRKDHLHQSIAHPLMIGSLLYGAFFYFLFSLPSINEGCISAIFFLFFSLSFIVLLLATFYLIRSYFNYSYYHIPMPHEILDYEKKLRGYYSEKLSKPSNEIENRINIDLENFLLDEYLRGGQLNGEKNDTRSAYLHWANFLIIIAGILLAFSFAPFYYLHQHQEIYFAKEVIPVAQEEPPKDKPPPPKGRVIKEGSVPQTKDTPPQKTPIR